MRPRVVISAILSFLHPAYYAHCGGRGADGWSLSHHGTQLDYVTHETAFPPPFAPLWVLFSQIGPFSRISRPRAPRGWKTLPRAPKSPNMRSDPQKLGYRG